MTIGIDAGCAIQVCEDVVAGNASSSRTDRRNRVAANDDAAGDAHLSAVGCPPPSGLPGGDKHTNVDELPAIVNPRGLPAVVHDIHDKVSSAAQKNSAQDTSPAAGATVNSSVTEPLLPLDTHVTTTISIHQAIHSATVATARRFQP